MEPIYPIMKTVKKILLIASMQLLFVGGALGQDTVIQDGEVAISDKEFEYLVSQWTKQMRESAIADNGDKLELINLTLANKKVSAQADQIARQNPDVTWKYQLGLESYQRDFVLRQYRESIELPDFSDLAQEQYTVKREKYAAVPERRISSHILFASVPGNPRDEILIKAQEVLDELRAGADFVEMVTLYSGEPGAKEKKGKFDKWISYGEIGVSPPYSEGLFTIGEVGEYSELVQTQFGVHIIRLDGVQEKSYKTFEEVKDVIIKEMETEYIGLAMKDYVSQFHISDDAVIDNDAVDAILAPYAQQE